MCGVGHVAGMGERRDLRERDHLEDTGLVRKIILKWIFSMLMGVHGLY
jgi:hypothetical protein